MPDIFQWPLLTAIADATTAALTSTSKFQPTPTDVAFTRAVLLTRLPLELVDYILHSAKYWSRMVVSLTEKCRALALGSNAYDCHQLILQTPPIPGLITDLRPWRQKPVRKIFFEFESQDQGFSCEPDGFIRHPDAKWSAPYHASFSWFEAYIERASAASRAEILRNAGTLKKPEDISADIHSRGRAQAPSTSRSPLGQGTRGIGWEIVEVNGRRNWPVQRNVHSGESLKKHKVVWNYDDKDVWGLEEVYVWERTSAIDGRGLGGEFVRALQPGDRILLVARAQKGWWENNIANARIEVYYYA
ncbi:hypothetical protein RUND412_007324 [Rhizina undulata]